MTRIHPTAMARIRAMVEAMPDDVRRRFLDESAAIARQHANRRPGIRIPSGRFRR